jgi:transcriptional regulator with XRE-family HTH domain
MQNNELRRLAGRVQGTSMPRGGKDKPRSPKLPKAGEPGYEKTFGFRLAQAMSKRPGMTYRSLGELLGLSYATVYCWRHNRVQPKGENLQRLLAALPDLEVQMQPNQMQPNEIQELIEISRKLNVLDEDVRRLVDAAVRRSASGRSA